MSIPSSSLSSEIIRMHQAEDADVVIVGGGPIGLWTAIQTKLLTGKKIVVLEKYNQYQRAEIRLNIDSASLAGIPEDKELKQIVQQWKGKVVPIKEMEEALAKRAHDLGVIILRGYQAEPKQLPQQFPSAQLFIGADGARSKVRKDIFNEAFKFNSTHQYIAQVQYVVQKKEEESFSKVKKIQNFTEDYLTQKFAEHFIVQTVRPQEDGTLRVTLQIFIDKATYDQISDATFGKPYYFETDLQRVPDSLRKVLIKWWGSREQFSAHHIHAEAGQLNKLTVIALRSYAAKDVVKKDANQRLWTLVGDASAAFPFFRAINNGLLLGTNLARCVAEAFKKQDKHKGREAFASSLLSYSNYTTRRVYLERIRAFIKNLFIEFSKFWLKTSNRVPWQSIKLTEEQKQKIYTRGAAIWEKLSGAPAPVYTNSKTTFFSKKMISTNKSF